MWFKKLADYDKYRKRIENIARHNPRPFRHWFNGQDRIYIPFQTRENLSGDKILYDQEVAEALKIVHCTITDYQGGYCVSLMDGGRVYRIGKMLEKAEKTELGRSGFGSSDVHDALVNMGINPEPVTRKMKEFKRIKDKYRKIKDIFINSPYRSHKKIKDLYIVISQNPHDIAKMTTDRNWLSCLDLKSRPDEVFCEVRQGGLIAYLVSSNDTDIERPISRILIRRFSNGSGESIAVPETTTYGSDIPGFYVKIVEWIKSHQQINPGVYQLKGAPTSDTFDKEKYIVPNSMEEIRDIVSLKFERFGRRIPIRKRLEFFNKTVMKILNSNKEYPEDIIRMIVSNIKKIMGGSPIVQLIKRYPHLVPYETMKYYAPNLYYEYIFEINDTKEIQKNIDSILSHLKKMNSNFYKNYANSYNGLAARGEQIRRNAFISVFKNHVYFPALEIFKNVDIPRSIIEQLDIFESSLHEHVGETNVSLLDEYGESEMRNLIIRVRHLSIK